MSVTYRNELGVETYLHINDGKCGMGYSGAEEEEEQVLLLLIFEEGD